MNQSHAPMNGSTPEPEILSLRRQLTGMTKLTEITCTLAAEHDLERILDIVTNGVCDALNCERASLFLYDESSNELSTRFVTELEIEEIRSSVDHGITGWVARERRIANIPDPHVDPRWNSSVDRETGFQTRNILAAPVISASGGKLLGVLELINRSDGTFDLADERLLQAFAAHAATALERATLLNEVRQSQRLQSSVEIGRRIQAGFIPQRLPQIEEYELAAWWQPAEAVGGDYYDVVVLPDRRLGLVVADVSGHGVGPSLIMASVRAMLHVATRTCSDPGKILSLLAETIGPDLKNGRFITFLMVAIDCGRHEVTYANAGHGPALYFDRANGVFQRLQTTGLPLGFCKDFKISNGPKFKLDPGDLLLLATDGTVELRNPAGEMFGRERLEELVLQNRTLPAEQLIRLLTTAITDFYPGHHPPDDATLLLLERKLTQS